MCDTTAVLLQRVSKARRASSNQQIYVVAVNVFFAGVGCSGTKCFTARFPAGLFAWRGVQCVRVFVFLLRQRPIGKSLIQIIRPVRQQQYHGGRWREGDA